MTTKIEYDIAGLVASQDTAKLKDLADTLEREAAKIRNLIGDIPTKPITAIQSKSLYEALQVDNSEYKGVLKHLFGFGITSWNQLTKSNLYEWKDYLLTQVCTSSARTYIKRLRIVMKKYEEDGVFPCKDYSSVLRMKDEKSQKVYLNEKELWKFEQVEPKNKYEKIAKDMFLTECYTGARVSDVMKMSIENIQGSTVSYVSKKTHVQATIRLKPCVKEMIERIKANADKPLDRHSYNIIIRRMCQRAGINEMTKVFRRGKETTDEKWKFISSHTGRISFATNLSDLGTTIQDVAKMMGHTDIKTTMRYIVSQNVNLNSNALKYFE